MISLRLAAGALALAVLAACTAEPAVRKLDPAKVDALRAELERTTGAAAAPQPTPSPRRAPARAKAPSVAQQRARAAAALPRGMALGALTPIGRDGRFAFALESARAGPPERGATLKLFDVASDPGRLVALHVFAPSPSAPAGPERVAAALELADDLGRKLLLADLRSREGGSALCGWWLASEQPRLICAPALSARSRHRAWKGMLIETWTATSPTDPVRPPGSTGRVLVFRSGDWREIDVFRCLGWPLDRALAEADQQPLGVWQREGATARREAALAAIDRRDVDAAVSLLDAALELDGCDVEVWRILGRVELGAGQVASAVPALAVAVALRPHSEAALLELADALLVLEESGETAGDAWAVARDVLGRRKGSRSLLDQAEGERPRDLARVLYERFLAATERTAPRLRAQREHAREQLERARRVKAKSPVPSPTAAR